MSVAVQTPSLWACANLAVIPLATLTVVRVVGGMLRDVYTGFDTVVRMRRMLLGHILQPHVEGEAVPSSCAVFPRRPIPSAICSAFGKYTERPRNKLRYGQQSLVTQKRHSKGGNRWNVMVSIFPCFRGGHT